MSVTVIGIAEEKTKKRKGNKVKQSCFMPLRVPDKQLEKHVVLLRWNKGEQSHYTWVKNFNRLTGVKPISVSVAFKVLLVQIY